MFGRNRHIALSLLVACTLSSESATPSGTCGPALAEWPEADALFRNDPSWLGADAAYSVDLGGGRVLWLFGDTYIAKDATRSRSAAYFIRNSVAVQSGSADPSSSAAAIAFRWQGQGGAASSFIPESGANWFWPLGGVRLPTRLVLFLLKEESTGTGAFGFMSIGTKVVFVTNPDDDPAAWSIADGNLPAFAFPIAFGAAVVRDGDFVYAYGDEEPGDHSVYLARFNVSDLDSGDASHPLFFDGGAWTPPRASAPAAIFPSDNSFDNPPTELSVQKRGDGTWLAVHTIGFGSTEIATRTSPAAEGPWTAACAAFTPPEASDSQLSEYAAKAHPELAGGSLILTYATNASSAIVTSDANVYFPRFVRAP